LLSEPCHDALLLNARLAYLSPNNRYSFLRWCGAVLLRKTRQRPLLQAPGASVGLVGGRQKAMHVTHSNHLDYALDRCRRLRYYSVGASRVKARHTGPEG
jgi:hypothetical protein